jgi:sugar transferase (PEP-CTERM system associated)
MPALPRGSSLSDTIAAPRELRFSLAAQFGRLSPGRVLLGLDAILLTVAWPVLLLSARSDLLGNASDLRGLLYPAADLAALYIMGMYRRDAIMEHERSLGRAPMVVGMGAMAAALVSSALPWLVPGLPRPSMHDEAQVFGLATVCFTICAFLARFELAGLLRRQVLQRRLLVLGAGQRAWDLLHMLGKEGGNLNYQVRLLHEPAFGPLDPRLRANDGIRILEGTGFDVLAAARSFGADQVVVAADERRGMELMRLLDCKVAGFPVVPYLTFVEKEIRRVDLKRMELGWLIFSDGFAFSAIDRVLKRLFDLIMSSVVLLATAPLLAAAILAIRSEGAGPVFYRQERVTQHGRVFRIVKLRTMRVDAEAQGAVWARQNDRRITRVGAFLRRSRIDELPQLWNVLKGEMSFVGPRPERPVFVEELAARIPLYRERHMVKAGLTGWAQVNYPYGASIDDARSKLSYDLYYVKNFSILFDFVILLQTLRVVLWPSGVR